MSLPADLWANRWTTALDRAVRFFVRHWLLWANLAVGLYAGLPWLSPLARAWGWSRLGETIFWVYSWLCHQSRDASYHLFGYQVAYCHRETALYSAMLLGGILFGICRRRMHDVPWWPLILSLILLGLDGFTQAPRALLPQWPLRTENRWAVVLTGGILPAWFYVGDGVGTLNWWLRTVTGGLFGLALVLALYPRVEAAMRAEGGD